MKRKYRPHHCDECGKLSFSTEVRARGHISTLMHYGPPKPRSYALRPYRCPHGRGWHVGRNHETLMIDFGRGRTLPLAT